MSRRPSPSLFVKDLYPKNPGNTRGIKRKRRRNSETETPSFGKALVKVARRIFELIESDLGQSALIQSPPLHFNHNTYWPITRAYLYHKVACKCEIINEPKKSLPLNAKGWIKRSHVGPTWKNKALPFRVESGGERIRRHPSSQLQRRYRIALRSVVPAPSR